MHPARLLKTTEKVIRERCPNIRIDDGSQNILNNFKRSKLCIIGNNSTTFLQTLTLDIPTILFWDENIIKIRNNSIKYFEFLKEVGIFSKNSDLLLIFVIIL